jgi:hypothetical protein
MKLSRGLRSSVGCIVAPECSVSQNGDAKLSTMYFNHMVHSSSEVSVAQYCSSPRYTLGLVVQDSSEDYNLVQ